MDRILEKEERMISSELMFNGVNVVLAVACLVSLFLVSKFVPDKRARVLLIVAAILIILSAPALTIALKIYKITPVAMLGDATRVTDGAAKTTTSFRYLSLLGSLFELIAIILFAAAARRLFSPPTAEPEPAGEEE